MTSAIYRHITAVLMAAALLALVTATPLRAQVTVIPVPSSATWDGRDDAGRLLPRGSYFVRVEDAAGARTLKATRVE